MTKNDAIAYFGSGAALARKVGKTRQWASQIDTIPPLVQLQLQKITRGKLKADPGCIPGDMS